MISKLLHLIHDLCHFLKLKNCFWIVRIIIKWDNRKSPCWKCNYLKWFYFDEYTFECGKLKTMCWGDEYDCKWRKE